MIFIRAEIMRDTAETSFQTNAKYNMIRDIQESSQSDKVQLMPNEQRPVIPPLSEDQLARPDSQSDGSE
jgi:hypothetical protein